MNFSTAVTRSIFAALLIFGNWTILLAQADSVYRLPAGTRISLKMDAEINSRVSTVNDTFIATVAKPVMIRDTVALPAGTVFEGRVSSVAAAAYGGKDGKLDVVFETLRFGNGTSSRILAEPVSGFRSRSSRTATLLSVFGGTLAGALLGAASGSAKGALIGTGVGAGLGTAVAVARKGKETRILKGQEFEIELKKQLVLPVLDY